MKSIVLALAITAPMAVPAFAQGGLFADGMTCARFAALDAADQVQVLSTVEPMGDDIEADDQAASEQWAATVASACADHPDRMVTDAARDAMGD